MSIVNLLYIILVSFPKFFVNIIDNVNNLGFHGQYYSDYRRTFYTFYFIFHDASNCLNYTCSFIISIRQQAYNKLYNYNITELTILLHSSVLAASIFCCAFSRFFFLCAAHMKNNFSLMKPGMFEIANQCC